ncbi:unnamed protein product [Brachionus calyciflorus]|uniref:Acyl-coenzyme A oxidase n=1 Tax=Brachionus calyciflorus TaxID=104777 RepID=A0A813T1M0_9BILA|nr:unnamed protein product [Brachionus calyciflorus]
MNADILKERNNSTVNLDHMKNFLGRILYGSEERFHELMNLRDRMVSKIRPISDENFYNLDRDEKYEIIYRKSLEIFDFLKENNISPDSPDINKLGIIGAVLGPEKILFTLHTAAFKVSIDLWGTEEQVKHWHSIMNSNYVVGTYIQTEIGHGTFVRGLETTATYNKKTQEFILNCPTLTSIKFWPGTAGITANFAIVMAKLIIDDKDYGVQAFVVQLRNLQDHKHMPGVETGDIGKKGGFESHDNGYVKFTNVRIPLLNMLAKNACVHPDGRFEKTGSELIMYACMLLLRAGLCSFGNCLLSLSITIAVRYSAVRRQTSNLEGIEPQIIEYQTQQYRIFQSLSTTYAYFFASNYLVKHIINVKNITNNFALIKPADLGKLHAISAGLKAQTFNSCLRFAQINRLCCGGHGYSAASGLIPIIQEADAGCTYEGDNVVLLLQTARYLLKCAQKGISPHLEFSFQSELKKSSLYKFFQAYFDIYHTLYDQLISEISGRMFSLVNETGLTEYQAWNECTVQLVQIAKLYVSIFIIWCSLSDINSNVDKNNQEALTELFELFVLYEITEDYSTNIMRLSVVDADQMKNFSERLYLLLKKVRQNAVVLVDSFNYLDSNLCSALGAHDGNVYEKLFDFARNSKFNQKEVHDGYTNILKPYFHRKKLRSHL